MQIVDAFTQMVEILDTIRLTLNTLVFLLLTQLLLTLAVVKNTRPSVPRKRQEEGYLRRLYHRIRRKKQLPKGDKKELVEK